MFRFVVSHLMLCTFGAHIMLGCCWHHAHADACETPANSTGQVLSQSHPHIHLGCGRHHSHEANEMESSQIPHDPAGGPQHQCCNELPCSYVTSAPSKLPVPEMDQLDVTPQLIALGDAPHQLLDLNTGRRCESATCAGSTTLDVRDATQVWLL